ncbi:MAG: Unknown protein [uncultured Sulfurovum sp.]|uniref:Glycosyltransferase 2-like domain-containing protein n=1 Tax=uncultured Sulfurovum sp. TaxID=269237 RepID=A0A6S6SZT5_9BACT|nr:MAG: Unknown protein [uncultured Sulfurovum sp.]
MVSLWHYFLGICNLMKNLICINTYKSPSLLKTFIWDYIEFAKHHEAYDFIVSLDGMDKESIAYCNKYNIPLLYSETNEGVGISKNRVLKEFCEYDNYFFIEDDVELLNADVFDLHLQLSKELNIQHFSLFEERRIRGRKDSLSHGKHNIIQSMYGSAQFNFFTKKGLEIVGGFHTDFAQYKRFGHTEHTYRFVTNGLSEYPFQIVEECLYGYFRWNDPISRVKLNVEVSSNDLFVGEEVLIESQIKYFPIKTISPYSLLHRNNVTSVDNIIVDRDVDFNKKKFYIGLKFIETIRYIKFRIKTLWVKN